MLTHSSGRTTVRPNLIASIVASVGIMLGSISPWVVFLGVGLGGTNGDGLITLVLGLIAAVILAVNLSTGSRELPWTWWLPPVIGAVCLLISAYNAFTFYSLDTSDSALVDAIVQVGWGLWLVILSSIVLCVTSSMAAGNARRSIGETITGRTMSPTTRWVVLAAAVLAILLLIAVVISRLGSDGFDEVSALGGVEVAVSLLAV